MQQLNSEWACGCGISYKDGSDTGVDNRGISSDRAYPLAATLEVSSRSISADCVPKCKTPPSQQNSADMVDFCILSAETSHFSPDTSN